jgi:hypothetical protein
MALVEILDVAVTELDAQQLRGRNIEAPKADNKIDSETILVIGWVLGRSSPAGTVEVVHDGAVLRSASVNVRRPDVAAAFPNISEAEQSGFSTTAAVPNPGESELLVQAVFQDGSRVPLGVMRVRQHRSHEDQYSESSVQDRSGPVATFFRRVLGRGGG